MDLGPLLHPVGPQDPGVYWRRRLVVLLVGVIVVVVVAILVAGSGGGGQATVSQRPGAAGPSSHPASPAASGSPTPTPTPTATPTASPSPTSAPSPTAAGPAGASAVVACTPDMLKLEARTDAATYPAGVDPKLTLLVTNTGTSPCRTDLGSAQLELRILSGQDRVWSSDDCAPDGAPEPSVLKPGEAWAASLTWNRTRSAPTCPGGQPAAGPGTYRVYARLGDRLSEPAVFHLT